MESTKKGTASRENVSSCHTGKRSESTNRLAMVVDPGRCGRLLSRRHEPGGHGASLAETVSGAVVAGGHNGGLSARNISTAVRHTTSRGLEFIFVFVSIFIVLFDTRYIVMFVVPQRDGP